MRAATRRLRCNVFAEDVRWSLLGENGVIADGGSRQSGRPIFDKEMRVASRRIRYYALRAAYAGR